MAVTRGILAQANPLAATLTDLYTVTAGVNGTCRVIIANRGAATSFRVSIGVAGAADSLEQYVAYDKQIAANDTGATIAFFVNEGDIIRVYTTLATLSFTFTAQEQTIA